MASVPRLHRKWSEVEADLAAKGANVAGRCIYHAKHGTDGGPVGPDGVATGLVEAEADHFVACFRPYLEGAC